MKASHVGFAGVTVCDINCMNSYSSFINVIPFEEKAVPFHYPTVPKKSLQGPMYLFLLLWDYNLNFLLVF